MQILESHLKFKIKKIFSLPLLKEVHCCVSDKLFLNNNKKKKKLNFQYALINGWTLRRQDPGLKFRETSMANNVMTGMRAENKKRLSTIKRNKTL